MSGVDLAIMSVLSCEPDTQKAQQVVVCTLAMLDVVTGLFRQPSLCVLGRLLSALNIQVRKGVSLIEYISFHIFMNAVELGVV